MTERDGRDNLDTGDSGAIPRLVGNTGETIVADHLPAAMRVGVASLCEVASADLNQKAGAWLASVMGLRGGLEVDVSFEGEDVVIIVMDDNGPDFADLDVNQLGVNGIVISHSAEDTFVIKRDRFDAAMNLRLNKASIGDLAGC